jgi:hypothetical protein
MTSRADNASPEWTGSFASNWPFRRERSLNTFRAGRRCVLASRSNRRPGIKALHEEGQEREGVEMPKYEPSQLVAGGIGETGRRIAALVGR